MTEYGLMSQAKFDILKEICILEQSPTELAKRTNFSVPYIHQQLTLLEAQGYIKRKSIRKGVAGKPKQMYKLNQDLVDIGILKDGFAERFRIQKDPFLIKYLHIISNLSSTAHNVFSKFYWQNVEEIELLDALSFISFDEEKIELFGITASSHADNLRKKISNLKIKFGGKERTVVCWINTWDECEEGIKKKDAYYLSQITRSKILFDKLKMFEKLKESV